MATKNEARIKQLAETRDLSRADLKLLLRTITDAEAEELYAQARRVREAVYGKAVYLRGLIEFTNVCKNNCYYCGIRRDNAHVERYRLDDATILECCDRGYDLDFRTFVLQGGEDPTYSDARICNLVREIKRRHPDCAVTLSIGEKSEASYRAYFEAGADRYLLRHETANPEHYRTLHPPELSGENRKRCLKTLKAIGYQVGAGMMVGAPGQTLDYLVDDLVFMRALQPEMIGIGPFIPHKDTPFGGQPSGTLKMTLHLLAIIRLM